MNGIRRLDVSLRDRTSFAVGGEAAEFNVPAPCDGVAMAHDGMRFVDQSRGQRSTSEIGAG